MPNKKSKKDFKVKVVYKPFSDAEERLAKALDMLINEEDLYNYAATRKSD